MERSSVILSLLFAPLCLAGRVSDTFKVNATVTSGCEFGTGKGFESSNFGALSFGTLPAISSDVNAASRIGGGSIVVTCTPGTAVTISLDYGEHGGNTNRRRMRNISGETLGYQLYQDAAHTTVWADGSLAYSIASFPESTQIYTVYGRLFTVERLPASGTYSDTITVTLTL